MSMRPRQAIRKPFTHPDAQLDTLLDDLVRRNNQLEQKVSSLEVTSVTLLERTTYNVVIGGVSVVIGADQVVVS